MPKLSEEQEREMCRLYESDENWTFSLLTLKYDISATTIRNVMKKHKVPIRGRGWLMKRRAANFHRNRLRGEEMAKLKASSLRSERPTSPPSS